MNGVSQVVGQGGETELPADVFESARQERTQTYRLLNRTERAFDGLPAAVYHLGSGSEARPQPPTRSNTAEISVNVECQQICRIEAQASQPLRSDAPESSRPQVEGIDECINETDRVVRPNVHVHSIGEKQKPGAVFTSDRSQGIFYQTPWGMRCRLPASDQPRRTLHTVCLLVISAMLVLLCTFSSTIENRKLHPGGLLANAETASARRKWERRLPFLRQPPRPLQPPYLN